MTIKCNSTTAAHFIYFFYFWLLTFCQISLLQNLAKLFCCKFVSPSLCRRNLSNTCFEIFLSTENNLNTPRSICNVNEDLTLKSWSTLSDLGKFLSVCDEMIFWAITAFQHICKREMVLFANNTTLWFRFGLCGHCDVIFKKPVTCSTIPQMMCSPLIFLNA